MKRIRLSMIAIACSAALAGTAVAQTTSTTTSTSANANAAYLKRAEQRFGDFAGSSANVDSLASGLRSGTEITLKGSGGSSSFTPPTKPMGYGNITRALDLAQRQLAAAGITDPTPKEIQIALMGGTLSGPNGDVKFTGVLQLRSQGMGWGQIAHAISVPAGMGKPAPVSAPAPTAASTGLGTASSHSGIVTAGGATNAAGASAGGGVGSAKGNAFGHANK